MPDDLGGEGLFEVDPRQRVQSHSVSPKAAVDKKFRVFAPDQGLLLPPSLEDWLPAGHLARFVDERLDLSRIHAAYTGVLPPRPWRHQRWSGSCVVVVGLSLEEVVDEESVCDDLVQWLGLAPGRPSQGLQLELTTS